MADEKSKIVTDATGPDAGPAPVQPEAGGGTPAPKQEQPAPETVSPDKATAPEQATPTQPEKGADAPKEQKAANFQRLVEEQDKISEERHAAYVGKTVRCLVDGADEKGLTARTPGNRLVRLSGDRALIGRFVQVKVTGANKWSLTGEAQPD